MVFCLIRTRLFYKEARIIRFPFDIRNKEKIIIGKGFISGRCCRIEVCGCNFGFDGKNLKIGKNVQINDFVHIAAFKKVIIGNNVLIASKVFISDINHGDYNESVLYDYLLPPSCQPLSSKDVIIGDNVWIGESVCVLPGVTIGDYSVVGAGSIVTKSIPPYSLAVGNPCKVIKRYDIITKKWVKV